ncbi:MAG: nucleoside triphosphate pyrophosphohydrolase [Lachnospiraceae bacterium]|nr:nucleoside triphosphate pyrophosphohydrolase [Lachnospiraceae bacterium]
MDNKKYDFSDFIDIIKRLRGEGGCPWDRVQTHESLRISMIEEAYEAVDAINNKNMGNLCEELGDVLLQVVFHARIAEEAGEFTLDDVINGVCNKMISRHTHIFGTDKAETPSEVLDTWERNKKKEKGYETQTEVLRNIPKSLPALIRAQKVQKKVAEYNFEFKDSEEAIGKFFEEINELMAGIRRKNGNISEEFGDLLFSAVNISRFFKINPEFSLTNSIEKFINRFEYIETFALQKGIEISRLTYEDINLLWEEAKKSQV